MKKMLLCNMVSIFALFPILLALAMLASSCAAAPKSKKTPDSASVAAEHISAPETPEETFIAEIDTTAVTPEEIFVPENEPVPAETSIEEKPPAENIDLPDVLMLAKPELPAAATPPPPVAAAPPPEISAPKPPPVITPLVTPPQVEAPPPVAVTPPPVVTAPPPTPPPVPPPAKENTPVKKDQEPPAIAGKPQFSPPDSSPPLPRNVPELPYPTPGVNRRQDEKIAFSRVVRATVGQLIEIPFRGTGWVYLGETGSLRGIVYDSRRLDPEGQSFIFRTESVGEYALKFFRQDFIRDFILNDYVQVIVGDPPETAGAGWFNPFFDRGRVIAEPRWPSSLQESQAVRADGRPVQPPPPDVPAAAGSGSTGAPVSAAPARPPALPAASSETAPTVQSPAPAVQSTAPPPSAASPPSLPPAIPDIPQYTPEIYLEKAKEEFNAGRTASAISLLDQFREHYPSGSDELWWLYGQFYEANSPSRNILTALDCYRHLVQEYPQSSRYDDARRRIAYLQRYYINIH